MGFKKFKMVCGLSVAAVMAMNLSACATEGNTEANSSVETGISSEEEIAQENTFVYTESGEDTDTNPVDTTITGVVSKVDGNEITLNIGGGMGGRESGGQKGGNPGMPDGEQPGSGGSSEQPDGEAPEQPDGEQSGSGGSSEQPDGENGEAPEMPDGEQPGSGEAPEMPDGEQPGSGDSSEQPDGEAPEQPDGEQPGSGDSSEQPDGDQPGSGDSSEQPDGENGEVPEMPDGESDGDRQNMGSVSTGVLTINDLSVLVKTSDGETAAADLSDISENSMISITFDESGKITEISISEGMGSMPGGGGNNGNSNGVDSYDTVMEYTEDAVVEGESFESSGTDENAVLVSGDAQVTLKDVTLTRSSADSTGGDNSSFYGVGAGLLTIDGTTYVNGGNFTTDAQGGAGIFSYADGNTYVKDATIKTTKDTSGGIHVAGGGTLYAWDLDVETSGESSAAIRSDRGGGTMVVDGGNYRSNGEGSPAVYCTADIAVNQAVLTASGSEAICMEGLNTIHLFDCDISGNMSDLTQNDTTWDIIVYQSMSGDSEVGNSTMQIIGGTLTSENGGLIYTTNTECDILLSDVEINYADDSEFFLQCTGNTNERGWGNEGANGSDCTFTADKQEMEGKIIWDSISNLDFYMTDESTLKGSFLNDETYAGNGGDGSCNVYISEDSTWVVTENSSVTNLYQEGAVVDEDGNEVSIVGSDGTVYVTGSSEYVVTVENYSTSADFTGAAQAAAWEDYAAEEPEEL